MTTRTRVILGLASLSSLFLYLRGKHLSHLLMWDEAWNVVSLRAVISGAPTNPFYWGFFYHPPFYMAFASLLQPSKAGADLRLELLSLVFSYATLLVVCLLSARIGGWTYALFTGLFLAVMPVSIAYDTWIKRDGLASLFGYLALLLLLKKKYIWCAVLLSCSLLAKENAVFFVLAATLLVVVIKDWKGLKRIPLVYLIMFGATSWWYLRFSEMARGGFKRFFVQEALVSIHREGAPWLKPAYYYVTKLLPDLGVVILIFVAIGACYLTYLAFCRKKYEWFLPVIVLVSVYVPISLAVKLKSPWLSLPANPALAMLAGGGALYVFEKSRKAWPLVPILLVSFGVTLFMGLRFSYSEYHQRTYAFGWPGANCSRDLAAYLNQRMHPEERLLITGFGYWRAPTCPIFAYYWHGDRIRIISGEEPVEEIIEEITRNRVSWFVVVGSPEPEFNFPYLLEEARRSALGDPDSVGWAYVWDTRHFWARNRE